MPIEKQIEKVWQEYWIPILFNEGITGIDIKKLKKELYKYSFVRGQNCSSRHLTPGSYTFSNYDGSIGTLTINDTSEEQGN